MVPVILSGVRANPLLRQARAKSKDPEDLSCAMLHQGILARFSAMPFNYKTTKLRNYQISPRSKFRTGLPDIRVKGINARVAN